MWRGSTRCLDAGGAYWILFTWLPSIVSNYRYLCEQSATQANPSDRCLYLPPTTGQPAEDCVEPPHTDRLSFVGMGAELVRSADYTPCLWTAGLPVDGSTAYMINTVAMFVVKHSTFIHVKCALYDDCCPSDLLASSSSDRVVFHSGCATAKLIASLSFRSGLPHWSALG